MAINFPTSLDVFTDPTASDQLNLPSHSGQHTDLNNAVEALEAKVGVDGSAVTSSLDYKVAQLEAISHGKILQVVTDYDTSSFSTTSTSFVATNASVTLTPTSATSKVFLIASIYAVRNTSSNADCYFSIDGDGTTITAEARITSEPANQRHNVAFVYLDSPASASALTYTLEMRVGSATGVIEGAHSITAFEVSA